MSIQDTFSPDQISTGGTIYKALTKLRRNIFGYILDAKTHESDTVYELLFFPDRRFWKARIK